MRSYIWVLFLISWTWIGCESKPTFKTVTKNAEVPPIGSSWFEDATDRLGIQFIHDEGPLGEYFMPQQVGSGCAIFDADGDGRLDLFFLQNGGPKSASKNQLYQQQPDGTFRNVSEGCGLDINGFNMGVACGDINQDGKEDILMTYYRGAKLFLNEGNCKFRDITKEANLENPLWGTSAAFFDYDRDGRLDLIITNYVDFDPKWTCTDSGGIREFCGPNFFPGTASRLFRNLGSKNGAVVQFEDVSLPSGIAKLSGPGLGVYCADFTGDGWPDIFIANDEKPNRLWINQKNGSFVDEAVGRGIAFTGMGHVAANMGIAAGDIDKDGLLDLFVTHLTNESNTLWKQGPVGLFSDKTLATGVVGTKWRGTGFGTLFSDFDCDGNLDLAIVNGRIARGPKKYPELPPFWQEYGEMNQLLRNDGKGKFYDITTENPEFCGYPNVARGLAAGDINNDGKPDLVVTAIAGKAKVFINRTQNSNHWLQVKPLTKNGLFAQGAEVRVITTESKLVRVAQPAESYVCSSAPIPHWGLGGLSEYQSIEVVWPDGSKESFAGGPANRLVTIQQGKGK